MKLELCGISSALLSGFIIEGGGVSCCCLGSEAGIECSGVSAVIGAWIWHGVDIVLGHQFCPALIQIRIFDQQMNEEMSNELLYVVSYLRINT